MRGQTNEKRKEGTGKMTRSEFAVFSAALKTYYPREGLLPNEQAMELWYQRLSDIPAKVAEAALNMWVTTNKWSPSIADIREEATKIMKGEVPDWGEAWHNVNKVIRKYGSYNPKAALEELDDLTRECVKRLGYIDLCRSTDIVAARANFRIIYGQLANRKQLEAQMPPALKELVQTMKEDTKRLTD